MLGINPKNFWQGSDSNSRGVSRADGGGVEDPM